MSQFKPTPRNLISSICFWIAAGLLDLITNIIFATKLPLYMLCLASAEAKFQSQVWMVKERDWIPNRRAVRTDLAKNGAFILQKKKQNSVVCQESPVMIRNNSPLCPGPVFVLYHDQSVLWNKLHQIEHLSLSFQSWAAPQAGNFTVEELAS